MNPIKIMINGLPGNVAKSSPDHALKDDRITLLPHSLTGPEIEADQCTIAGTVIELIHPADREKKWMRIVSRARTFHQRGLHPSLGRQ
jgi:4-hydroxy-tetrahydrodipicolinate reductase